MTDPTPSSHGGDDDAAGDGRGHGAGLAGWQKVVGLVGLAVVAALVILLAGDHGPGRHAPAGNQEQPAEVEGGGGHGPAQRNR